MCYSRAYLGVHYPGDLLAGAVWGTIVAFALYALVNRYYALTEVKTAKHTQLISIVGTSTFVLLAIVSAVQTCVA
jgi:membrane protein